MANTSGQSATVAVPTELPAGMQMDKVFGAPATGTGDAFLEALGVMLVLLSLLLSFLLWSMKRRAGALT